MKILNAQLSFNASRSELQQTERQQAGLMQTRTQPGGNPLAASLLYEQRENVRLDSSQSARLYSRSQISHAAQPDAVRVSTQESLLQNMVSHAFSRNVRISAIVPLGKDSSAPAGSSAPAMGSRSATQASIAFGQSFRYRSEQSSCLTIEGRLNLADQRQIDFVLHTRMDSRLQFESASGQFASAAVRTDPLILNLQGGMAQLTDAAFDFDLDGDGSTESVSMATGGSGFIAFDKNGDGKINNGSELFGTRTGNGFAELAQYDDDGNGFIDESDAIFAQLKFWSKDEKGSDRLTSLKDVGVGAIYLDHAETPLYLRGQSAQELGMIRSTGFFVSETGEVGTVQQVDLARRDLASEERFAADFANPQFIPDAAGNPANPADPARQQLQDWMTRLDSIREEYMARLDAMGEADKDESKNLLEKLVIMLEQQIEEMAEKRQQQEESAGSSIPTQG